MQMAFLISFGGENHLLSCKSIDDFGKITTLNCLVYLPIDLKKRDHFTHTMQLCKGHFYFLYGRETN